MQSTRAWRKATPAAPPLLTLLPTPTQPLAPLLARLPLSKAALGPVPGPVAFRATLGRAPVRFMTLLPPPRELLVRPAAVAMVTGGEGSAELLGGSG
jgi:hypothetical protein